MIEVKSGIILENEQPREVPTDLRKRMEYREYAVEIAQDALDHILANYTEVDDPEVGLGIKLARQAETEVLVCKALRDELLFARSVEAMTA